MENTVDIEEKQTPWGRLVDYLDWKINPVLLRDLRLYTRGRLLLTSYFIILAGLVCLGVIYALFASYEEENGRSLIAILTTVLSLATGALVPNLVYERFRAELSNRATELALMSPLSPARLVRGKLVGAWCVSLILVSLSMPIFATAYLLGGVNLFAIVGCVGGVMVSAAIMPTAQLFLATQRKGRLLSRGFAGIMFVLQVILMSSYSAFLYHYFTRSREFDEVGGVMLAAMIVAGVLIAQFLYFVTVSRLRGESENRDAAPRVSLAVAAYLGGAIAVGLICWLDRRARYGSGIDMEEVLVIVACVVAATFCLGFLIITHSSPAPARNIRELYRDKPLRGAFLQPGVKSLCAYFLVSAAVILGFGLVGVYASEANSERLRAACFAMAPFMAIAYGLVVYYHVVLRFAKDMHNPNLLPVTIVVANVAIGLVAVFVLVIASITGSDMLYSFSLAASPVGLVVASMERNPAVRVAAAWAPFFLGGAMLLLLPAVFGGVERRMRVKTDVDDEA